MRRSQAGWEQAVHGRIRDRRAYARMLGSLRHWMEHHVGGQTQPRGNLPSQRRGISRERIAVNLESLDGICGAPEGSVAAMGRFAQLPRQIASHEDLIMLFRLIYIHFSEQDCQIRSA